jgi:ABC-type transporter Mla maintaining outer membrane lipid asymmetry ATPase subunit MlaF
LLIEIKTKHKVTLAIVTHNMPSARHIADQMAFLDGGHLRAQGTVRELEQSEDSFIRDFMVWDCS